MQRLATAVRGIGPDVLLVHGGMTDGPLAWFAQEPLAAGWTLRILDRAGYGKSSELSDGENIELDATLVAAALGDAPAHVVGHSSGAMVALLAAAAVPEQMRSLAIIEPPAYRFIQDPDVQQVADACDALWDQTALSDGDWLLGFFDVVGEEPPPRDVIALLEPHICAFRRFVRRPWDIDLPVEQVRAAAIPTLAVTGGHAVAFERLNDEIAAALDARRAVVPGAGHEVQSVGAPFNQVVTAFWSEVEARTW